MGLRDRGKRLKAGAAPEKKAPAAMAPKLPLAEPRSAEAKPPAAEKATSPQPRKKPAEAKEQAPKEAAASSEQPTAQIKGLPAQKVVVSEDAQETSGETDSSGPETQELSISDISLDSVSSLETGSIGPDTASATRAPAMDSGMQPTSKERLDQIKSSANFNKEGDKSSIGAGLKLTLVEVLAEGSVKVNLSGGLGEKDMVLYTDRPLSVSYELQSDTAVNVVLEYKGRNLRNEHVVGYAIEGAASKLANAMGLTASATKSALQSVPTAWRFIPSVVTMAAGAATVLASVSMASVAALGTVGQYGIAALGAVTMLVGLWSITARKDYNERGI